MQSTIKISTVYRDLVKISEACFISEAGSKCPFYTQSYKTSVSRFFLHAIELRCTWEVCRTLTKQEMFLAIASNSAKFSSTAELETPKQDCSQWNRCWGRWWIDVLDSVSVQKRGYILKNIWSCNNIFKDNKFRLRLIKTLLVPALLYGYDTWKTNNGDEKAIDVFHKNCLKRSYQLNGKIRSTKTNCWKDRTWNRWLRKWSIVGKNDGDPIRGRSGWWWWCHYSYCIWVLHTVKYIFKGCFILWNRKRACK